MTSEDSSIGQRFESLWDTSLLEEELKKPHRIFLHDSQRWQSGILLERENQSSAKSAAPSNPTSRRRRSAGSGEQNVRKPRCPINVSHKTARKMRAKWSKLTKTSSPSNDSASFSAGTWNNETPAPTSHDKRWDEQKRESILASLPGNWICHRTNSFEVAESSRFSSKNNKSQT